MLTRQQMIKIVIISKPNEYCKDIRQVKMNGNQRLILIFNVKCIEGVTGSKVKNILRFKYLHTYEIRNTLTN